MTCTTITKASTFTVFSKRSFTLLWSAQLISSMGNALTMLAASILVFRLTGSALSVGLMLISTAGPSILVGLLAGVIVDRYDRKRILCGSILLRIIVVALIPVLVPLSLYWVFVLVALNSSFMQFFESAYSSALLELASDNELSAANSMMAISSVGSTTVGFAAAGMLTSNSNPFLPFYVNAAAYLIVALLILATRIPPAPVIADTSILAVGSNLLAGLRTVRDLPVLRSLLLILIPFFLIFGLQNSLFLPFAMKTLGGTEFEFGVLQAVEAVGIVLGSFMMAQVADRIREGQWLVLSFCLMALAGVCYSFSSTIPILIILVGMAGFVYAPSFIGRQLAIQRATPGEMRGRVNSAFFVIRDVMIIIGMSLAGLGDFLSVRQLYLISSLLLLAVAAMALVLPGLSRPASEWLWLFSRLRGLEAAPRLGTGTVATVEEINLFIAHRPELAIMDEKQRRQLAAQTLVASAPPGKTIVYRGETSSAAYFILKGSVGVGYIKDGENITLNHLNKGDFFGEVAALTGSARTANVITEEDSEFLVIPAKVMKRLAREYADLNEIFYSTMVDRLSVMDLPLGTQFDQGLLRDLRKNRAGATV